MRIDPSLAEFRFGYGLSPDHPGPGSVEEMLDRLAGPDIMATRFPVTAFDEVLARLGELWRLRAVRNKSPEAGRAYRARRAELLEEVRAEQQLWLGQLLARRAGTRDGFRERLVAFWADHFTAQGKSGLLRWAMAPHVESAIRPHVTGSFPALLASAVKSPLMLHYLDQNGSIGPGSPLAQKKRGRVGLNENLAREILELHTLGADGPYDQRDVRQLAELLTGLSFAPRKGTIFRPEAAEPGAEEVLGRRYGGGRPGMQDIDAVLHDLALHPATAAHLGRKLAVHFVADQPDPALVAALSARFTETGGDLMAVYDVLLSHPAARDPAPGNIRPPLGWVSAVVRALAVPPTALSPARNPRVFRRLPRELARMGQPYERSPGPDGWAEEDATWVTPQGLAARLQWALAAPQTFRRVLPDPRRFAETALGPRIDDRLRFAAAAAETRADGIGLILAAPEFQRS